MQKWTTCSFAMLVGLTSATIAAGAVTIDFEDLHTIGFVEGNHVPFLNVTDPDTGFSTKVSFRVFNAGGITGFPILIEEGATDPTTLRAFEPSDTPAGEVPDNGNDWFLGNGTGNPDNYRFIFSAPVESLSLDLYDFRSDGPFTAGTPGADKVFLETFDQNGDEFPINLWLSAFAVPDPRPVDGNIVNLLAPHSGIFSADLAFVPGVIDAGTGVDNITFTILPEPGGSTMCLLAIGLLGLVIRKR